MAEFELAAPSERTLSAGEYLLGALVLAAILAPLAWAAWRARAAILPGWTGAPARLAEIVLALSALTVLAQLLGTVSAFQTLPLILGAWAIAIAVKATASRRIGPGARGGGRREAELSGRKSQATPFPGAPPGTPAQLPPGALPETSQPPSPGAARTATTIAAIVCAAVVAAWAVPTLISIAGGMGRADSLWYHMPLSARFVQTGSLAEIHHFDPIFLAAYYPSGGSILHAVPILAWSRDLLSPLLNLGFLGLGLLSAWCIGRPYGLGPHALVGGAIAFGSQMLIEFQAGQALNDAAGTALVLAAVALLVNTAAGVRGLSHPAAATGLLVAGLAAGLAAGMKLSFLAPVGALLIGLVVIAGRGARLRTGAWFALPALLTGGYWYLRNLIAVGNPVPAISSLGPIELPGPERTFELRPGFSVAHYWDDPGVWKEYFFPGLEESFGVLWPLILIAILGAGALALWRGSEPLLRVLGGVVMVTALAYLVTPLTAAGEEGDPISFVWNVRYVAPAAAIGLALLPCLPALRATPQRRALALVGLAALLAATVGSLVQWQQGHTKGAIAAAVVTLVAFWLGARLHSGGVPRGRLAGGVAVGLIGVLAAGWLLQDHYLERRYQNLSPQRMLAEAVRFGTDLRDARVAVAGVRGVFNQYPFYGTDLSNHVQWLGFEDEDGAFRRIPTCERWREALADGEYTHVVTMYDPYYPGPLTDTKEALWTREDPASREVLRDGPVSVFELTAEPDPAGCGDLPDLSEAELNGDSVNRDPTANQPPVGEI